MGELNIIDKAAITFLAVVFVAWLLVLFHNAFVWDRIDSKTLQSSKRLVIKDGPILRLYKRRSREWEEYQEPIPVTKENVFTLCLERDARTRRMAVSKWFSKP